MARKPLIDYEPIAAEYVAGLLSIPDLAKKYKCNRTALYNYIKKNNIKIDDKIKTGISSIKRGMIELYSTRDEIVNDNNDNIKSKEVLLKKQALMKGFEALEAYGDFGSYVVGLLKKGLKKGNDMLEMAETPEQYSQVMRGIKTGVDALGIMPKTPLIAIQNNVNSTDSQNGGKKLEINVNFINAKESKENITEAEVIDE